MNEVPATPEPTASGASAPERTPFLKLVWFGNVNVWMTDGEESLLNEGWVSRFSRREVLFRSIEPKEDVLKNAIKTLQDKIRPIPVDNLKAVLVSHTHYDHVLDAPKWATNSVVSKDESPVPLLGPPDMQALQKAYKPFPPLVVTDANAKHNQFAGHPPTGYPTKNFLIRPIPIHHSSGRGPLKAMVKRGSSGPINPDLVFPVKGSDLKMEQTLAFHVTHTPTQKRILLYGSAGVPQRPLTKADEADILFLSLANFADAGEGHMWNMLSQVILASGATTLVPVHWDDLFKEPGMLPKLMKEPISNIEKALVFLLQNTGMFSQNPNITLAWPTMWRTVRV